MKMKVKALVAALTLGAAVQAHAAISVDGLPGLNTGTGDGELFLNVIDRGGSAPESYVLDLGTLGSTGSILSDPGSLNSTSIGPDTNLQALLANQQANGGDIFWQIDGINNSTGNGGIGALITSSTALTDSNTPQGIGGMNGPFQNVANYVSAVNQAAGTTNTAENLSVVIPSSNGSAYYDIASFGNTWFQPVNSEAAIGSSMGFYFAQATGTSTTAVDSSLFTGVWTLQQDGTLTYNQPSTVPLPPAVWLLGSALVGLVGVGRRRTVAAV